MNNYTIRYLLYGSTPRYLVSGSAIEYIHNFCSFSGSDQQLQDRACVGWDS